MSFEYNPQLYLDVRQFIEDHLDLIEEDEYDVLTAKVFESWLIHKVQETGYIFFVGPPRSGKTRALEVLSKVCYNSKMAAYMSTATIYRLLDMGYCTLFLDEIQQYLNEEKLEFLALLNAGQRKGPGAWLLVPLKNEWIPTSFKVFGSKILASTRDTAEALATRCVIISMMKNVRTVPLRIDEDRAETLSNRLSHYVTKVGDVELPDMEALFLERGFKDYRNIEVFINLVAVTPPEYRSHIVEYAKAIDDQITEEEGITQYADVYEAVEYVWKSAKGGKISVNDIAEAYNDGRPEAETLSNQSLGALLNIIGLRRVCRMPGGRMGRYASERTINRLRRRYGPSQVKLDEVKEEDKEEAPPVGASPASLPSQPPREVGLFTDAITLLEAHDNKMYQTAFFETLVELGYDHMQADRWLRADSRFAFMGTQVKLVGGTRIF